MKVTRKSLIIFTISGVIATGAVFAYAHNRMNNVEHRAEWIVATISDKLELDESQTAKLDAVKDEVIAVRNRMHSEHEATHSEILSMLDQSRLDRRQVLTLIDTKTRLIQQEAPALVDAFAEFYDSLSESQHEKLREHVTSMIERRDRHMENHFRVD